MHPESNQNVEKLDAVVAAYIEAVERGEQPDRHQLMAAHPVVANELAKFFLDFDRIQATRQQSMPELNSNFVPQHEPKPGAIISGRYKLLENIGEGGMGSVWVAEQQQPVKRRVAVKLVKAGMDSKQVLARFEAERQALAVMDHPNIAKVFDGGMTEQGRPYFVMEYVRGIPITAYCDQARLSLKDRLNLFVPVCQAVQHAHHKGIVHRDLKPSNILICLYDGKPIPKVIDFGLAKALHQSLTDQSIYTAHGVMVGTPLYMSPEQAEHNNLDVDARTDIYSLGVVLYELLTGTTPLERDQLRSAAYNEVLRLIKEVDPPRPSTRLSGSSSLPSIAAQRSIDPRHLQKSLVGELDWIVMKSLEKERTRRYETATGLARDIERFLNDEAVEACPPSRSYRFQRFLRKHKRQVIVASSVFLALLVGVIGASWGWFRATEAEKTIRVSLGEVIKERDGKNVALADKSAALAAESAAKDLAECKLIEGLLRPIGYSDQPDTAELRAFVDWSAIPDSRLKLRVLELAFEDPATALRVACRAERSIQACVGLSAFRRGKAIELVTARQREMAADPRIRVAACWLALELGSENLPNLVESITFLSRPNSGSNEPRDVFAEFVVYVVNRVDILTTDQLAHVWDAFFAILEETDHWRTSRAAGSGLVALVPWLNGDQVPHAFAMIIGVIEKRKHEFTVEKAAIDGLVALAPRLSGDQLTRSGDAVIANMVNFGKVHLWKDLVQLAPKLSGAQMTRCGDALIAVLEHPAHWTFKDHAGKGLVALAPRLTEEQVVRGWSAIMADWEKSTEWEAQRVAGSNLAALAPKLSAAQMLYGGDVVIGILEKTKIEEVLRDAEMSLVVLAPRLRADQVTRGWSALTALLERSTDEDTQLAAGNGLAALAPRLTPDEVTRGWDVLLAVLARTPAPRASHAAGHGLVALAPRLSGDQLTQGWDAIFAVREQTTDSFASQAAGEGLAALCPRLNGEQLTRGGEDLIAELDRSTDDWNGELFAVTGLAALAPRLSGDQLTRAVDALITHLEKSTYPDALEASVNSLVVLGPQFTSDQLVRCWHALIAVLDKSMGDSPSALLSAGNGIVALAARLSNNQCILGGDALIAVVEKTTDRCVLQAAGNGLVALSPRLAADQRVRIAQALVALLQGGNGEIAANQLASIVPLFDTTTQDRISTEAMTILLDDRVSFSVYLTNKDGFESCTAVRHGSVSFSSAKSLAKLLSHPGCVDGLRELMLQRFEELLFHNGNFVYRTLAEADAKAQSSDQPILKPELPPRRFHNLYDAAEWIQQNWPDFDLEASHPVVWRGERQ